MIEALGLLVKVGCGLVMKPVDALEHLVFVLEETGYGALALLRMGDSVAIGDSPEPGPAPAVTVTV